MDNESLKERKFYKNLIDLYNSGLYVFLSGNREKTERDFIKKVILEKEIQLIECRNKFLDLRNNGLPEFQILKNNGVEHKVKCLNEDQYLSKLWNEQINIREVKRFYEIKLKRIESNNTQSNSNQIFHILHLASILDSLKDLELWPDVKLDIKEILDEVRKCYSESLIESNKRELTKNLYLNEKPNIFYMRELDRVLNLTNASIQRIDLEFKKYPDFIIEKYTREYTLQKYFHMSVSNFKSFYLYAKDRIKEVKELQKQQSIEVVSNQTETKKDLFIIAELLATNEIQIIKDQFIFKGEKYESGNSLNNEVNEFYRYHPKKKFTQYLNDFKSKNGQKYFLETFDSEKNKPDDSNIKRLRKLKKYFDKENIIISNKDFQEAFKRLN